MTRAEIEKNKSVKKYLFFLGCTTRNHDKELDTILRCFQKAKIELKDDYQVLWESIDTTRAIELLGEETFWNAICKTAFTGRCRRWFAKGKSVVFTFVR